MIATAERPRKRRCCFQARTHCIQAFSYGYDRYGTAAASHPASSTDGGNDRFHKQPTRRKLRIVDRAPWRQSGLLQQQQRRMSNTSVKTATGRARPGSRLTLLHAPLMPAPARRARRRPCRRRLSELPTTASEEKPIIAPASLGFRF